ncbi:MAG: TonB-dependent siderophore receptor [Gammaproteobacteria bacterium]
MAHRRDSPFTLMRLRFLSFIFQGGCLFLAATGSLAVESRQFKETESGETAILPKVTVVGTVEDEANDRYHVTDTATATKTVTSLMETPVSIQVVPQQVLQEQQVIRFDDALENVSDVFRLGGEGIVESFLVRGFQADAYYRDGVRIQPVTVGVRDPANLERIEVLKGPAAALYGRIEPGGLVNLVTKQPQSASHYSLQQQFGSFDFYRTGAEATGSLSEAQDLTYRIDLAYQTEKSFREFVENDRVFVAPVLKLSSGDRNEASLYLEYQHEQDFNDNGIPVVGNRPAAIPRGRNLQEPGGNLTFDSIRIGVDGSHAFTDQWQLRGRFDTLLADITASEKLVVFSGLEYTGNCTRQNCPLARSTFEGQKEDQTYYATLDLSGEVETFGIPHTLLIGGDYWRHPRNSWNVFREVPAIDVFHPVHTPFDLQEQPILGTVGVNVEEAWYGFYMQDQVELPYGIHVLAGFRYTNAIFRDKSTAADTRDQAVTPRAGLLWRPLPEFSLYGHYAENFGSANGQSATGLLPPQKAREWELGLKTELLHGLFTGSLAWFDLSKTNLPVADPDPVLAAAGFAVALGEVRNRGLELDLAGEPWPGWKLIASYAWLDSEIVKDRQTMVDAEGAVTGFTPGNQGNRFFGVPRSSASFWSTYAPPQGPAHGLKLGAGLIARGQAEGNVANDFQIPGYILINLMAGYAWKMNHSRISLQINLDNLLDKRYFLPSAFGQNFVGVGAPRSVLGLIRMEF